MYNPTPSHISLEWGVEGIVRVVSVTRHSLAVDLRRWQYKRERESEKCFLML